MRTPTAVAWSQPKVFCYFHQHAVACGNDDNPRGGAGIFMGTPPTAQLLLFFNVRMRCGAKGGAAHAIRSRAGRPNSSGRGGGTRSTHVVICHGGPAPR